MTLRPRLLPTVIFAAAALLAVKLVDLWSGGGAAIAAAWGETKAATPPAAPAAAPAAPAASDAASAAPAPESAAAPPSTTPPQAAVPTPATAARDVAPRDPLQMSAEEIGELQQLAQRRAELDKRAAELSEREVLMQAAEQRINEKIATLQSLDKSIQSDVKSQDTEQNARLQSLAHMYEQMKPQDAARILDQLDVPVVLTMLGHMREMKAAPILAAMDSGKAKAVTLALAEQRQPPTAVAAAPAGAAAKTTD